MIQDAQGHHLSGATREAVNAYDSAIRAFNLVHGDAVGLFDEACQAAPEFAMAYLGKAWVFALGNDPGLMTQARALIETARPLALNDREQAHLAALSHLTEGARAAAVAVLDRHLMRYPFDLVAHQGAVVTDGFLGRFSWVRDRSARAIPFWSKDQPGYATLLAFHAFGLEEAGNYARAEDESREAAEREPLSFWPHHTVAHVMEMAGRPEDGLGWMAAREGQWSGPGHMNEVHIWWHKALFHLELGQYDAALALYDGPIRSTQRPVALSLTNASALLWRLDTLGVDVGDRWGELAALWEGHADGKCLVFGDIHAAMAELRSDQEALVERRLKAMRKTAANGAEAAISTAASASRLSRASRRSIAAPMPRRSTCCCQSASVYGRSAAATRSATLSTGPLPRPPCVPVNAMLPCRWPTNAWRAAHAAPRTAASVTTRRP